jgi:hypothetical protein
MTADGQAGSAAANTLLRRGLRLEWTTLAWNVVGIFVLAVAALSARSVALVGFGLDSLVEIVASLVVVWELTSTNAERQRRALTLIGAAFVALAVYLTVQAPTGRAPVIRASFEPEAPGARPPRSRVSRSGVS